MGNRGANMLRFLMWQVGDVHAGAGRRAAVFELMARPDAALDFGAAMQGAGHSVAPRWAALLAQHPCVFAALDAQPQATCCSCNWYAAAHVPGCWACTVLPIGRLYKTRVCSCHCGWEPAEMRNCKVCEAQVPGAPRSPAAVGAPERRQAGALQRKVLSDVCAALAHQWQR